MKDSMIRSTVSPTASKESINRGKNYEDGGLEVVAIKALEISKPVHQVKQTMLPIRSLATFIRIINDRQSADLKNVGAQSRTFRNSKMIRKNLQCQHCSIALVGHAVLGIKLPIPGFGKLLRG
jgi:hypothetical protein